MKNQLRIFLGIAIMILGCSIPTLEKMIVPSEPSIREVMKIDKPSDEMVSSIDKLSDIIKDKKDRESFAIFNKEFSNRVSDYEAKGEVILQVYSEAREQVFGKDLKEKYDSKIGPVIVEALKEAMGESNSFMTEEQKKVLRDKFNAVAWSLGGDNE